MQPATLYHDTVRILDADEAAGDLFACEAQTLIGLEILTLLVQDDFKGLGRLRMRMLRESGRVPPVEYLFHRFDGSQFEGSATTERAGDRYRSIIRWKYDLGSVDSTG